MGRRKDRSAVGSEFVFNLLASYRVSRCAQREVAARRKRLPRFRQDLRDALPALEGGIVGNCHVVGGEGAQARIVVTGGLELGQGEGAVAQKDGCDVMDRQQRLELGLVGRKPSM